MMQVLRQALLWWGAFMFGMGGVLALAGLGLQIACNMPPGTTNAVILEWCLRAAAAAVVCFVLCIGCLRLWRRERGV